jgi:Holliday junction resolvasome RuvABC DNA-binding subunit
MIVKLNPQPRLSKISLDGDDQWFLGTGNTGPLTEVVLSHSVKERERRQHTDNLPLPEWFYSCRQDIPDKGFSRTFVFASGEIALLFKKIAASVKGLGPTTLFKGLAAMSEDSWKAIVTSGDTESLKSLPGIGPKIVPEIVKIFPGNGEAPNKKAQTKGVDPRYIVVSSALQKMGLKVSEFKDRLTVLMKENSDASEEALIQKFFN